MKILLKLKATAKLSALLILVSLATGCKEGTGIDTRLSDKDEFAYKVSLEKAWLEMTDEQKNAYNWAVQSYTLTQLLAKYPKITPRKVISGEVDAKLAPKEKKLTELKEYLATNSAQLAKLDAAKKEARLELGKIEAGNTKDKQGKKVTVVRNGSRFNVSSMEWALLISAPASILNDAVEDDVCYRFTVSHPLKPNETSRVNPDESPEGILECGMAVMMLENFGSKITTRFALNMETVKDAEGKYILPREPGQSDCEKDIATLEEEIKALEAKRAVLN